jgi:predicted MFS family arabinose efflux permease
LAEPTPPSGTRWGIVWLAIAAGYVAAMQVGKVPPALPLLRDQLDVSMVAGGWVASLFSLTSACLGLAAGIGGDRLGPRRTLLLSFVCLALGSLVGGFADGLALLLVGRMLESIGFVGVVVVTPALLVAVTAPGDRRIAVGIWSTYLPVGFALMLLAALLLLPSIGWRGLWFANAGLALAFLVLFWQATRRLAPPPATPRRWREVRQTLGRPGLWLLAFCFLLYSLQWFAVMTWLPTFLVERAGYGIRGLGLVTALVVLINAGGNLAGTWALQRGVSRWSLIAFSALASAGIGGMVFADLLAGDGPLWLAFAYSLASGVTPAAALTGAVQHAPSPAHVGAANGLVVQGAQGGSLLGPPVLALVVTGGGWQQAPWLFAVASGLSLLLAWGVRRVERRGGGC